MSLTRYIPKLVTVSVITIAALATPALAASDMFLKLPDIPGESKSAGGRYQLVEVETVDVGDHEAVAKRVGPGSMNLTLKRGMIDARTLAAASSFDEVIIYVRKDSGDAHLDYLKITLTDVIVSKAQAEPSRPAGVATLSRSDEARSGEIATIAAARTQSTASELEEISISYKRITVRH